MRIFLTVDEACACATISPLHVPVEVAGERAPGMEQMGACDVVRRLIQPDRWNRCKSEKKMEHFLPL